MWKLNLLHVLWGIWEERNAIVFKGEKSCGVGVCNKIKSLVLDNFNMIQYKGEEDPMERFHVLVDWRAKKQGSGSKPNPRFTCHWRFPPQDM